MGFGKDGKGVIIKENVTVTPGALASGAVIKAAGGVGLQTTSFRIIKTQFFISQGTAWAGDGDELIFGLCNGELSVTEIAEAIQINGPIDRNDRDIEERASRAVWLLVDLKDPETSGVSFSAPPNNGLPIEKNFRWTFTPTEGWDWFAFNPLSGAITTGAVFNIKATHFGVWV